MIGRGSEFARDVQNDQGRIIAMEGWDSTVGAETQRSCRIGKESACGYGYIPTPQMGFYTGRKPRVGELEHARLVRLQIPAIHP